MPETFTLIIWSMPERSEIERHEGLVLHRAREMAEEILAAKMEGSHRINWDEQRRMALILNYYGEPLDVAAAILAHREA